MITVTPTMLTEKDVRERLDSIARRNHVPQGCYDELAADSMSDFDALKWVSLLDLLRAAREREDYSLEGFCIPGLLRSMYGMPDASQEELENTSDLTQLAA